MSAGPPPQEDPTAAERRLVQLLGVLRADPPVSAPDLPARVLRAARWQRSLRRGLELGGWMTSAASDAVGLLTGRRSGGERP